MQSRMSFSKAGRAITSQRTYTFPGEPRQNFLPFLLRWVIGAQENSSKITTGSVHTSPGVVLWFSYTMLQARARSAISVAKSFSVGFGVNLMNPKVVLFFMTFLPQFVSAQDPNAAGKLFVLGALFVLISIPVTAPMVFAADRFAAAMKRSPRVTRAVDYLFAGVFSAFALKIITAQAK